MAGFLGVGSDVGCIFIIAKDDALVAVRLGAAVEEENGDIRMVGEQAELVGGVGGTRIHDIHDEEIRAEEDGLLDLGGLGGLVEVPVVLPEGYRLLVQQPGELRADGRDVGVAVVVVEDGCLKDRSLRSCAAFGVCPGDGPGNAAGCQREESCQRGNGFHFSR